MQQHQARHLIISGYWTLLCVMCKLGTAQPVVSKTNVVPAFISSWGRWVWQNRCEGFRQCLHLLLNFKIKIKETFLLYNYVHKFIQKRGWSSRWKGSRESFPDGDAKAESWKVSSVIVIFHNDNVFFYFTFVLLLLIYFSLFPFYIILIMYYIRLEFLHVHGESNHYRMTLWTPINTFCLSIFSLILI